MNILLTTNNHLGDVAICTPVIHNIKLQFPQINIKFQSNYNDIFDLNPYVSNFNNPDFALKVEYAPFSQRDANGGSCVQGFNTNMSYILQYITGQKLLLKYKTFLYYKKLDDNKYGDYWIINANCQKCSLTKAYPHYQKIIDLRPDIKFIQIGSSLLRDIQTPLKNTIDLRGKTDIHQLISLVANAKGVISPPSAVVHIASGYPNVRSLVISGAREPLLLTEYDNTTHFTSTCKNFNKDHGCMKFFTRAVDVRTCTDVNIIDDIKYPKCMCAVDPLIVAKAI